MFQEKYFRSDIALSDSGEFRVMKNNLQPKTEKKSFSHYNFFQFLLNFFSDSKTFNFFQLFRWITKPWCPFFEEQKDLPLSIFFKWVGKVVFFEKKYSPNIKKHYILSKKTCSLLLKNYNGIRSIWKNSKTWRTSGLESTTFGLFTAVTPAYLY